MAHRNYLDQNQGATLVCLEGTRNEVRNLRNSGSLETSCHYIITNYNRQNVGAARILLHATSPNTLSKTAMIQTGFDNIAWDGEYDIDTNRITRLHDNLGNKVSGRYGNEVDRFAWGNTRVTQNVIDNCDVFMDLATTATIYRNSWTDHAYCDLRGFTGQFRENTFQSYGRGYLNNASGDIRRSNFNSLCYFYMNGQTFRRIWQSTFSNSAYVRKFGGSNLMEFQNAVINNGDVRQYNGLLYLNNVDVQSRGRIYNRNAVRLDIRNTSVSDLSIVDVSHTGAANYVRIWYASITNYQLLYLRAAVTAGNYLFYFWNGNGGTVDYRSGTATVREYNMAYDSRGYARHDNIAGNLYLYDSRISSQAELRLQNITGTHYLYRTKIDNYASRIRSIGTNYMYIYGTTVMSGSNIEGNLGRLRVYYSTLMSRSTINVVNGAGANYVYDFTGTSGGRINTGLTGSSYRSAVGTNARVTTGVFRFDYSTAIGSFNHICLANNFNRGNFHNLVNNLV